MPRSPRNRHNFEEMPKPLLSVCRNSPQNMSTLNLPANFFHKVDSLGKRRNRYSISSSVSAGAPSSSELIESCQDPILFTRIRLPSLAHIGSPILLTLVGF